MKIEKVCNKSTGTFFQGNQDVQVDGFLPRKAIAKASKNLL